MAFSGVTAAHMAAGLCAGTVCATTPALAKGHSAPGPVVASILVGSNPEGVAVDDVTDRIYVANTGGDSVSVINGATNKVIKTIALPTGASPSGLGVNPATDKIYVAEPGRDAVQLIDGASNALGASIPLANVSVAANPIAIDPATDTIFVATLDALWKIEGSTNQATVADGGFGGSDNVAANQTTGYPYLVDANAGAFDDRPGGSRLSTTINPIAAVEGNGVIYVSNCLSGWYSVVWEFDASNDKALGQVGAPWLCPRAIAVRGSTVFAASNTGLAVLNVKQDAVTGAFPQIQRAVGLAIDAKTGTVYATDGGDRVFAVPRQAPAFTTTATGLIAVVGDPATSYWMQTSANPAPTYSEAGKLPAGVSLAPSGEIFVSPAAGTGGRYPITISAANGVGAPAKQSFVVTINQAPAFTSAARTTCKPGHQCRFTIATTGYPPATITMTGRLPRGLRFVPGHGGKATIEGEAAKSAAGRTFHPTFSALDSAGQVLQKFTLRVS